MPSTAQFGVENSAQKVAFFNKVRESNKVHDQNLKLLIVISPFIDGWLASKSEWHLAFFSLTRWRPYKDSSRHIYILVSFK